MNHQPPTTNPDRCFSPDPAQRKLARELHENVKDLPIVSPHGHVDPRLFADPEATWGSPADLLIIPDHYVFRMLYSQGISLESLGVPTRDGSAVETDHRQIWQTFAESFYLFRGTPTGIWLTAELVEVFGVKKKLTGDTAQEIYDQIESKLTTPDFRPRALFDKFNIEVMATTDAATDPLTSHQQILNSDWGIHPSTGKPRIRPTFRPDAVVNLNAAGWRESIDALSAISGIAVDSYCSLIAALENRRAFFKQMGATATDHGALTAYTEELGGEEADAMFAKALRSHATEEDATRFTGHLLIEMARMSIEDGLVMQLHVGSCRNHNRSIFERFGPDKGCDIPVTSEFTRSLQPLLNKYGNDPRLTLVLFTLDETAYSRELAPLAGHYPALRLGPPWWFHDSFNGMRRYFDQAMETAGLCNTAGFNDDTRAFPSIPARHDLWRRASADWIAGLLVRGLIDEDDAQEMVFDCTTRLAREAYRL
ncbi:MAG: glucuronate isomerase [Armatimonadetes bacterium CG2_30_59_28]|nr:glucuronate isomerase [Armatimonadota bacterium]OIO98688.1 MAG: glucuronate isomerase [Armatimonadetes bacterium CG2_30_59_28]PIU63425.1 MAG: glucuronate isomerase [Armatimonadetes bacterium CG07_land_8_20_14_0_80_59_28]